jgi:hypothetical protein
MPLDVSDRSSTAWSKGRHAWAKAGLLASLGFLGGFLNVSFRLSFRLFVASTVAKVRWTALSCSVA